MKFEIIISAALLGGTWWFWNVSDFGVPFFVVLTAVVFLLPLLAAKQMPRFGAVYQTICTIVATVLLLTLEDKSISYAVMFTLLVLIAIYKTMSIWDDDFYNLYLTDKPITIGENLYHIIDKTFSDNLRFVVVLIAIGFYVTLAVPYVCFGEMFLAFIPLAFILYRTVRIFMLAE